MQEKAELFWTLSHSSLAFLREIKEFREFREFSDALFSLISLNSLNSLKNNPQPKNWLLSRWLQVAQPKKSNRKMKCKPKLLLRVQLQRYQRKMRWAHTKAYVTISFFEDKEANAP